VAVREGSLSREYPPHTLPPQAIPNIIKILVINLHWFLRAIKNLKVQITGAYPIRLDELVRFYLSGKVNISSFVSGYGLRQRGLVLATQQYS